MKKAIKRGFSFGLTSAVITTLGLMVGLNAETSSRIIVLGGILTIAIADACSDALGMHISEEFLRKNKKKVWNSTISTFISKLVFALTFTLAVLFLPLQTAVIVNIIWGLLLLTVFSYKMAKEANAKPMPIITEHLAIAIAVITLSYLVGNFIGTFT